MIEQIEVSTKNVLLLDIIDGFDETDQHLFQKLFEEKLKQGFQQINVLVKLDEVKISHSSVKAFMEDALWGIRNFDKIGHLAIVAHSKVMKALVPIDNLFFERASKGRLERYFDISQMEEALKFVEDGD